MLGPTSTCAIDVLRVNKNEPYNKWDKSVLKNINILL